MLRLVLDGIEGWIRLTVFWIRQPVGCFMPGTVGTVGSIGQAKDLAPPSHLQHKIGQWDLGPTVCAAHNHCNTHTHTHEHLRQSGGDMHTPLWIVYSSNSAKRLRPISVASFLWECNI